MDPEKRKILEDYLSNEDNIIHIQKITDNLNAIADKKPLPHPELVENDHKKIKLNHIIQPYNNLPPGSCGGHSYEIDSLYLEIKRACAFENDGEHQDKNLDKIRKTYFLIFSKMLHIFTHFLMDLDRFWN